MMYLIFPFQPIIVEFRENCNNSCCCAGLGKIGFSFFDRNRGPIMLTMCFMSFVALILSTVSLASMSFNNSTVKDTYWTRGKVDDLDIYIGVQKVNDVYLFYLRNIWVGCVRL